VRSLLEKESEGAFWNRFQAIKQKGNPGLVVKNLTDINRASFFGRLIFHAVCERPALKTQDR
jgi:hypothetical protein